MGPAFQSSVTRFRRFVARIERSEIWERRSGSVAAPGFRSAQPGLRNKRRKRNAGKRRVTTAASCDAARALLERARLTAFHHGSHLGEYFIPKVSFRPGFLGRGLHGRYPPSPVPVQGCTSHPGRNAGRHDAQAAREQAANPPAGTALAPMTRRASVSCPSLERGLWCNCNRDECQLKSDVRATIMIPAIMHLLTTLSPIGGALRCGRQSRSTRRPYGLSSVARCFQSAPHSPSWQLWRDCPPRSRQAKPWAWSACPTG